MDNPYAPPPSTDDAFGSGRSATGEQRPVERGLSVLDSVRWVFQPDQRWHNILMATLLFFIPIVGPLGLFGWCAEMFQRLVRQHPRPLPKFDFEDFGRYISKGFRAFVVQLAYIVGLMFPLMALLLLPAFLTPAQFAGDPNSGPETSNPAFLIFSAAMLLFYPLIVAATIVLFSALTRIELTGSYREAFSLGPVLRYAAKTWWPFLWTGVLFSLVSLVLILVGLLACGIGMYVAAAALQIAQLHLRWQIYNRYVLRGGTPIEAEPLKPLPSEG